MAFDNATNRGRVTKVIEILGLIEKSATSNDTSDEEVREILDPLYRHLKIAREEKPEPVPEPKGRTGCTAPPWASVMDMAREAKLKDLSSAMLIFLDRMEEELKP